MPAIEVGRLCYKVRGHEAGRKCVIVDIIDENLVLVTGPKQLTGVKRRRVNIKHIAPLDRAISISKGASDEEVLKALQEAGLLDFMREKVKMEKALA
ncbi:50S ribosomal protein L14e [Acidilobus sp. SCGC AC-742_M05]|nr:50S ribosomal protein L14e [Acidianus sp.]PVU68292.1 50S ribosomal protein L14e [Acidilobus sp. SCGC AC-742_M05]PVU68295.1 50S ribosomal protein L14e [Acidilobus sp. SCGC AC-742_M05]